MSNFCDIQTGICSDGNWIPIDQVGKLENGDLVETPVKFPHNYPIPYVNHYGIYLEIDGKPMIAHNPYGGHPEIIPIEQFEKDGGITRFIRSGMSADHIIKKTEECKEEKYRLFNNCEDFISYVCNGCRIGSDQRFAWALFIIMIVLIITALHNR